MFAGLCAFPLTPMDECGIDEAAFVGLVARLAQAGVDSIGALGSTGNYAYLRHEERSRVARLAVEAADGTPVMVGVGAVRTRHVLDLVEDAQAAGAAALLLAPVSCQPLRIDEVFDLYVEVDRHVSVPEAALAVVRAARTGDAAQAIEASGRLSGLWSSSRPTAACESWPPRPRSLDSRQRPTCRARCAVSTVPAVSGSSRPSRPLALPG